MVTYEEVWRKSLRSTEIHSNLFYLKLLCVLSMIMNERKTKEIIIMLNIMASNQ